MAHRDIIVVGASMGGVEFLPRLAATLPGDLPATVLVVQHMAEGEKSYLPEIIARRSKFPFAPAVDGAPLELGRGWVAVPGVHLMVEGGRIRLARGPKDCRARPSVDVLFRSAAYEYGPRVIGIVLSGNLDDGTAGLWAIKDRGGVAIVQDLREAPYPSMPMNAARHVQIDHRLGIEEISPLLVRLTSEEAASMEHKDADRENLLAEVEMALADGGRHPDMGSLGAPVSYTCPECHGSMIRINEGSIQRYRCHTGHAFGDASLDIEQSEAIESALWQALAKLEERELLLRDIAARSEHATGAAEDSATLGAQAADLRRVGNRLREILKEPVIAGSGS